MSHLWVSVLLLAVGGCGASSHADSGDDDDLIDGDGDADSDADSDTDSDADSDGGSEGEGEGEGEGEQELDLGPHARPSDYPEADDWVDTDPSALGDGDPCCDLVGEPLQIDGPHDSGGPPVVEWNGESWGVLWAPLTYRSLSAEGEPLTDIVRIGDGMRMTGLAMTWGADRYGVVGSSWRREHARVLTIDRSGGVLTGPTELGAGIGYPDIARQAHGHGWVMVYTARDDADRDTVTANWVDDDAIPGEEPQTIGLGYAARVVGLRSRVSVLWLDGDGVWHRSLAWPDVTDPVRIIDMATMPDSMIEGVAYRDFTAVAAMDGGDVWFVLVDPWQGSVVAGPSPVAASAIADRRPGVAPVSERGYLGLCYETGPGPWGGGGDDGVAFLLVGPDATRWGEEVRVVEHLHNIGGCAVGWSGEEFLVAWWEAGGDGVFNRMLVQRVAPRL